MRGFNGTAEMSERLSRCPFLRAEENETLLFRKPKCLSKHDALDNKAELLENEACCEGDWLYFTGMACLPEGFFGRMTVGERNVFYGCDRSQETRLSRNVLGVPSHSRMMGALDEAFRKGRVQRCLMIKPYW